MGDEQIVMIVMIASPVFFVVCWLFAGWMMPRFMGWTRLEELFPDRPEDRRIERFGFQALYLAKPGSTWAGMSYRGCVTLEACETGLRVSIWKLFQPFSQPIFLPWGDIEVVTKRVTGFKMCGLKVGQPQPFTLSIIARIARRIELATGGRFSLPDDLK
ncbi:hypothetical protein [uncultured Erythrobacter sp.]|uniref:hypothetical protein n=1 Tax=uncultured Erythrobacter sp. TaxID=263913 RepID=UPI00262D86EF|nr:hypothetical protein [uncultured Erythrobacter sp.]